MLTKPQAVALIEHAYKALSFLNNMTFTAYRDHCYSLALGEEKTHRTSFREFGWGITRNIAAKLFVVQRVAQCLTPRGARPSIKDVIRYQPSYLYAASLVENFGDDIRAAFARENVYLDILASLDYAELVKTEEVTPC